MDSLFQTLPSLAAAVCNLQCSAGPVLQGMPHTCSWTSNKIPNPFDGSHHLAVIPWHCFSPFETSSPFTSSVPHLLPSFPHYPDSILPTPTNLNTFPLISNQILTSNHTNPRFRACPLSSNPFRSPPLAFPTAHLSCSVSHCPLVH